MASLCHRFLCFDLPMIGQYLRAGWPRLFCFAQSPTAIAWYPLEGSLLDNAGLTRGRCVVRLSSCGVGERSASE
jgi:hypothetical protein